MSFKTFQIIVWTTGIALVLFLVSGIFYCAKNIGSSSVSTSQTQTPNYPNAPTTTQTQQPRQQTVNTTSANTEQIKAAVESWLRSNPDRRGKNKLIDVLPNQPFKVTMVRFPDADAEKFSNNPSQWSQVKIDTNRDGIDDEKWLLKNGWTYKREVIDSAGRTMQTFYFK